MELEIRTARVPLVVVLLSVSSLFVFGCVASRLSAGAHTDSRGVRPVVDFEGGVGFARKGYGAAVTGGLEFTSAPEGDENFYSTVGGMALVPLPKGRVPLWAVARGATGRGGNADEAWGMERGSIGIGWGGHAKPEVASVFTSHTGVIDLSFEVSRQHGRRPGESDQTNIWSAGLVLSVGGIVNGIDMLYDMIENHRE